MTDLRTECLAMAEEMNQPPVFDSQRIITAEEVANILRDWARITALLRRVAGALPQEPQGDVVEDGWQPIETVPPCRDVLCAKWLSDHRCFLVVAQMVPANANRWVSDGGPMTLVPTHWRPLPAPPVRNAQSGEPSR